MNPDPHQTLRRLFTVGNHPNAKEFALTDPVKDGERTVWKLYHRREQHLTEIAVIESDSDAEALERAEEVAREWTRKGDG
jgi:hypothetical protein